VEGGRNPINLEMISFTSALQDTDNEERGETGTEGESGLDTGGETGCHFCCHTYNIYGSGIKVH